MYIGILGLVLVFRMIDHIILIENKLYPNSKNNFHGQECLWMWLHIAVLVQLVKRLDQLINNQWELYKLDPCMQDLGKS